MQVLSPVGEFKVAVDGVRIRDGRLVVHMSMGAWRSEATLERGDLPYAGVAARPPRRAAMASWRSTS